VIEECDQGRGLEMTNTMQVQETRVIEESIDLEKILATSMNFFTTEQHKYL